MAGTASQKTPQDLDKNFAQIGVQGTLGTADTKGTSVTTPMSVDPSTGAQYVYDLASGGGTTNVQGSVQVTGGTITRVQTLGTLEVGTISSLPNLPQGSINVTAGTVNAGTVNVGTITTGTIVLKDTGGTTVTTSGSALDINLKTLIAGEDLTNNLLQVAGVSAAGGTLPSTTKPIVIAGTSSTNGTIFALLVDAKGQQIIGGGTVDTLTTVANLTNGTVRVSVGTIATGSIAVTAGTVIQTIGTVNTGTINTGTVVIPSGTINVGTAVMPSGTLNVGTINAGTINSATISTGSIIVTAGTVTVAQNPLTETMAYGTTTNGTIGTLVAAPSAGSSIFITSLDVNVQNGTAESVVSFGLAAQGNQVISRGNYSAGGGIAKLYVPPHNGSATGTALTFNLLSGAGTISYNVAYFIAVP